MSKPLNLPDITLLSENQKSELFNYMNYLLARNNALMGVVHIIFGLVLIGLTSLYSAPLINERTAGDEFTPFFQVLLWVAQLTAFGIMVAAFLSGWKNKIWSLPLYNFGVKQFRVDFNMKYGLDISRLSVKEIWSGVVEN